MDLVESSARTSTDTSESPQKIELCYEEATKPKRRRRTKQYKHLPQNQCPSICRVCRNPAVGYHYEVPSCNGCKTFFRRTIITGRKFKCFKVSNCLEGIEVIDTTQRVCRACRFEKCVQAGMNPMAIQAEIKSNDGEELRKEIAKQRASSQNLDDGKRFFNFEQKMGQVIGKLAMIESKLDGVYTNGMPMGFKDTRDLSTILTHPIIFDNVEIPSMSYTPVKYSKHTGLPKRRSRNFVHSSCLASIEYSKTFDFSNHLDADSKILLLKHVTLMCVNLTNAYTTFTKQKSDRLLYPDGSIYGPPPRKKGPLIEKQRSYLQNTLVAFMENKVDRTEYMLLKAVILCNPAIDGMHPETSKILQREREVYGKCLLRYCLQQHGLLNGPARFAGLLAICHVIERQQKEQKDYHVYIKMIHAQKHVDQEKLLRKSVSVMYEQLMEA